MENLVFALVGGGLVAGSVWIAFADTRARLMSLVDRPGLPGCAGACAGGVGESAGSAGEDRPTVPDGWFARVRRLLFGRVDTASNAAEALSFDLELVAICLQSGLPTEQALCLAARASGNRSGLARLARALELGELERVEEHLAQVVSLIEFSRATGVALAPLLSGLALDVRRAEHRRRQLAAAKLGVSLVIPLGVCVLPSFILLGVVPVLLTLLGDMAGVFQW